jgi:CYTH domain-containing protein/predicted ATPase
MLTPSIPVERERRWLVKEWLPTMLKKAKTKKIVQGYFDILGDRSFRVRIVDSKYAVVTLKKGSGEVRTEHELAIDIDAARVMLEATSFRVEKCRYLIDGWELDIFEGSLSGIVILEYEARGDEPIPSLPSWIHRAIDVTDALTNLHLARMSKEIEDDAVGQVTRFLEPKLPKIVLTGGPCSGKSTLMREIQEKFGHFVHCVPEVATILVTQVGIRPDSEDEAHNGRFQKILYRVQRSFEEAAELQALKDGKKAIVLDRGTLDAVAYFNATTSEQRQALFEKTTGLSVFEELQRYALVLFLESPPSHVYQIMCQNNPARTETYDQAIALSERTRDAWIVTGQIVHLFFIFKSVAGSTWNEKREAAFKELMLFFLH